MHEALDLIEKRCGDHAQLRRYADVGITHFVSALGSLRPRAASIVVGGGSWSHAPRSAWHRLRSRARGLRYRLSVLQFSSLRSSLGPHDFGVDHAGHPAYGALGGPVFLGELADRA
jgi:hypothetical protein